MSTPGATGMTGDAHRVPVRIPTPLRSYTGASRVAATGTTVIEVLDDLDRQFPGLKFRMIDEQGRLRKHMRIFVNTDVATSLDQTLNPDDTVTLMQALSGG